MLLPVLGIDISKASFDGYLINEGKTNHKKFSNDTLGFKELVKWLTQNKVKQVHVSMEATGRYYEALAEFLYSKKHIVSVINPAKIKGFAKSELARSKTDKLDAALIARFCEQKRPPSWQPTPEEIREVQELTHYLEALKKNQTQEKNRLQSGLKVKSVKEAVQRHLDDLAIRIAELEKLLKEHAKKHEKLNEHYKRITSIIGVGDITAFAWLGEMGYAETFLHTRQVEAFVGLTPSQNQSGTSVCGKDRLSKVGNNYLRKSLYMPAVSAIQHNPVIRDFADRLKQAGKPSKVIICAVMRKLLRIIYAVVRSGKPFDLNYKSKSMHELALAV